jgi:hypothetical protein
MKLFEKFRIKIHLNYAVQDIVILKYLTRVEILFHTV